MLRLVQPKVKPESKRKISKLINYVEGCFCEFKPNTSACNEFNAYGFVHRKNILMYI